MSFTLISAIASIFSLSAGNTTDQFQVVNCTGQAFPLEIAYTTLVGNTHVESHYFSADPYTAISEVSSDRKDAEELLVSFIPSPAGLPVAREVALRPVSGNQDTRFAFVGLLRNGAGLATWKRLRNFELQNLDVVSRDVSSICQTLENYGSSFDTAL